MILIRNFEIVKTPNDYKTEMDHLQSGRPIAEMYSGNAGDHYVMPITHQEVIKGRLFRTKNGEDVVLGVPKKDQELIGVLFEAFDEMEERIRKKNDDNKKLLEKLDRIRDRLNNANIDNRRLETKSKEIKKENTKLRKRVKSLESIIIKMTEEKYDEIHHSRRL